MHYCALPPEKKVFFKKGGNASSCAQAIIPPSSHQHWITISNHHDMKRIHETIWVYYIYKLKSIYLYFWYVAYYLLSVIIMYCKYIYITNIEIICNIPKIDSPPGLAVPCPSKATIHILRRSKMLGATPLGKAQRTEKRPKLSRMCLVHCQEIHPTKIQDGVETFLKKNY